MSWLVLVGIAVLAGSCTIYIDNYVSDSYFKGNGAPGQKCFYIIFHAVIGLILSLIFRDQFAIGQFSLYLLIFLSGMVASLCGIFYYRALEIDNSTNLGIFIQLKPIIYLLLGFFFLNESVSTIQIIAIVIIASAPALIYFTTKRRSRKITGRALLYAFIYVLLSALSGFMFAKAGTNGLHFGTEMAVVFLGKSFGNAIIMIIFRKWNRRMKTVLIKSRFRVLRPLFSSGLIGLGNDIAYRAALVVAPSIALASTVLDSTKPIAVFLLGIILSIIWPKFGREKLDRKTVMVHLVATILVVTGIVLLQV